MQKLLVALVFSFLLLFPVGVNAQTDSSAQGTYYEAEITQIQEEKDISFDGMSQPYQKLQLTIHNGDKKDQLVIVENGNFPTANFIRYKVGDDVIILGQADPEGNQIYFITDRIRRGAIYWLVLAFVGVALLVGRMRGLTSLVGMTLSFVVILTLLLPLISKGYDPLLVALLSSIVLVPITFYLSHGVSKKTTVAIISTFITLIFTAVLAQISVAGAKLTGYASEEAAFLQVARGGSVNVIGLVLAGVIISALGILDDITISQSAVVAQLHETSPKSTFHQLYSKAMTVGRDHIASMINTLILVYTGAALPLLLLFVDNPRPFGELINYEIIAQEIVVTLIGSISLVLAVPLTSALAAYWYSRKRIKI